MISEQLSDDVKEKLVQRRGERDKRKTERDEADLRFVVESPQGRRVLWRVFAEAKLFCGSHVPGDSHATTFNEGKRDIGLFLFNDLRIAKPDAFAQMQREYVSELKQVELEESKLIQEEEKNNG